LERFSAIVRRLPVNLWITAVENGTRACALRKSASLAVTPAPVNFEERSSEEKDIQKMKDRELGNYLRSHRRKSGLSQRQLGQILGYENEVQVSRHERSETVPPLNRALGYHIVFRVPIAALFPGIYEDVREAVETQLGRLEIRLHSSTVRGREAEAIARILVWMMERRDRDLEADGF